MNPGVRRGCATTSPFSASMYRLLHPSAHFRRILIPLLSACILQMASAASVTYPIYFGHATEANTLTNLGTGGGGGTNGTRLGIATATTTGTNPRIAAGTSNVTLFTIPEAGTITLTYHLDNTVAAAFQRGEGTSIEGLYDASSGIASSAAAVRTALTTFNTLSGLTVSYSGTVPGSGAGGTGAPAQLWTATYTIAEGSAAIGKTVALGFHSTWSDQGAYIFGREAGLNNAVLTFTAVPEASSAASLALGAAIILRRRRA